MGLVTMDILILIHYPNSSLLIKSMDLLLSDFRDLAMPTKLILSDTPQPLNSLANIFRKAYQPTSKRDLVLYTIKRIRRGISGHHP